MKKLYSLLFLTVFLGLHLSSVEILAKSCTQLSLPENAIARLCWQDGGVAIDLDFSPDGKTLASVIGGQVVLWDTENRTEKLTIKGINGRYVRYSPDGKTLICGDVVYDATTGEPKLLLLDGDGYTDYVLFSPDGKTIAGAGTKGIRFWKSNVEEPNTDALPVGDTPINVLPTDTSAINTPGDSPTSVPIATSSTTVPGIYGLSYSPDGKELAITCELGIWIYDTESNIEITLLTEKGGAFCIGFSPDGGTLASGAGGEIHLWDAVRKKHKFTISTTKISRGLNQVLALAFSPDGKIFASVDNGSDQIHFWDTETGKYKYTLSDYQSDMVSITFSTDGNTLASGFYYHTGLTQNTCNISLLWLI